MTAEPATSRADRRSANRLLARVGHHGGVWIVVLIANVGVLAVAETALPAVLGRTIDGVLGRAPTAHWLWWSALLVAVLVACDVVDEIGVATATARSTAWLRATSLRHLLSVRLRSLERLSPGDLASRLVGNTEDAGGAGPDAIATLTSVALAVAGVVALAVIDPWLCVTFVAGLPFLLLIFWSFAKDASRLNERYLETQGVIASRLVGALQGARTIASAGTTDRETRRVLAPLEDLHRHGKGMWRAETRITAQDTLMLALLEIGVLAVAGLELSRGRITPGELFAASQYVVLASSGSSAISSLSNLIRQRAAARRVDEIRQLPSMPYGDLPLPPGPGRVEIRGVTVRAGDRVLLEIEDLVIDGGALVAVVGPSGAGKSQFAALVGRLTDPDVGEVFLDGRSLTRLDRDSLRRAIGYGFERPALIGDTIMEAIEFGPHIPSKDEVTSAARAALADGFIRRMPDGYSTPLADAPMSGGEVQRIGLARAFAHAGRVLVLDDVAASLDTVTEHEIAKALTGAMADRTRILVAHRASTAARADLVLWLHEGRVRAIQPHHLLWQDADYRALFEAAEPVVPAVAVAGDRR